MNFIKRLKASTSVKSSPMDGLDEINSETIKSLVKEFGKISAFKVQNLGTDGYNEDDAGVEITFSGKETSSASQEIPCLEAVGVVALGTFMKKATSKGLTAELNSTEDYEFILLLLGPAD